MLKFLVPLIIGLVLGASHSEGIDEGDEFASQEFEKAEECLTENGGAGRYHSPDEPFWKRVCATECLMKKFKTMDDNGKLNATLAFKYVRAYLGSLRQKIPMAEDIFSHCAAIKVSDNHCKAAEEYAECVRITYFDMLFKLRASKFQRRP